MKTIHINGDIPRPIAFLRKLYKDILYKDNSFHYFIEPTGILVRSNYHRLISHWLNKQRAIVYEIYDYPSPEKGKYGEQPKDITVKFMSEFMQIYHAMSVMSLKARNPDYSKFMLKVLHAAFNIREMTHWDEINYILRYSAHTVKLMEKIAGKAVVKNMVKHLLK